MRRRKWTAKEKLQIVLEGLSGKSGMSEICARHGVGQTQYYKWRDQFLANGTRAFESDADKQKERLISENIKLKTLIGHLTIELKKTEDELKWLES